MVALFVYTQRPGRGYVGLYNDDAYYILASQSLWKGPYVTQWTPTPEAIKRWPGFPLFLAPFVKIVAPHWNYLSFIPAALMVLSCLFYLGNSAHYI